MFEYIKGKITAIEDGKIILENSNRGYIIYMSDRSIEDIKNSNLIELDEVKIHTYMQVKEDGIFLFGFSNLEEKKLFEKLILVSKIGPKTAIGILSKVEPAEFAIAIINNDIKKLSTFPGVGKKTAGRIVVELQDKLSKEDLGYKKLSKKIDIEVEIVEEAKVALKVLGYYSKDIEKVIDKASEEAKDSQEIIKNALKLLSK